VDEEGSEIAHLHPVGTGQECPNEEEGDDVPIVRVRPQDQYRNHDRGSRDIRHVAVHAEKSQAQLVLVKLGLCGIPEPAKVSAPGRPFRSVIPRLDVS
jgi:hypothetical protein